MTTPDVLTVQEEFIRELLASAESLRTLCRTLKHSEDDMLAKVQALVDSVEQQKALIERLKKGPEACPTHT